MVILIYDVFWIIKYLLALFLEFNSPLWDNSDSLVGCPACYCGNAGLLNNQVGYWLDPSEWLCLGTGGYLNNNNQKAIESGDVAISTTILRCFFDQGKWKKTQTWSKQKKPSIRVRQKPILGEWWKKSRHAGRVSTWSTLQNELQMILVYGSQQILLCIYNQCPAFMDESCGCHMALKYTVPCKTQLNCQHNGCKLGHMELG